MSHTTQGPNFPAAILSVSRQEIIDEEQMKIEGELPEDLQGHLFFLAVAGFVDSPSLPGTPIVLPSSDGSPIINGDGMICRIDFHKKGEESKPGEVWLKTKNAGTPCYWADKATANRNLNYAEYKFNTYGVARISEWLGVRNVVNTAWLPMQFPGENYRLLVTLDAGRPYEIDLKSLDVVTPIGWNKEWTKQLKIDPPFALIMSTAHPYFDPRTNEMFAVNFTQSFWTMLPPQIRVELKKVIDPIATVERFLRTVKAQAERLSNSLENFQGAKNELPFLEEFENLLLNYLLIYLEIEKKMWAREFPKLFQDFWEELQAILQEELQDKKSETLKSHLANFIQLLKLALQFLQGIKEMDDVVHLIRWDGKGDFERWKVVLPDGTPVKIKQTMHQIGVTQDYIILMDSSLKIGLDQLVNIKNPKIDSLVRKFLDYPQSPETSIYIVRRDRLKAGKRPANSSCSDPEVEAIAQKIVFPREVFHFVANYDNPDNKITLHCAHANAWDVAEWLRKEDTPLTNNPHPPIGMVVGGMDVNCLGRYSIDGEKGKLCESTILTNFDYTWTLALFAYSNIQQGNYLYPPAQFENIYWNSWGVWKDLLSKFVYNMYESYQYREESVQEVCQLTQQGNPANLFRVDTKQMKVCDSYKFPPGYFGNSPQFVPREGGGGDSTDGYIVCTVLYDNSDSSENTELWTSEIWIFDAKDLKRGGLDPQWGTQKPLCRLSHPQMKFGFTTHTTWLPKIAPREKGIYCVSVSKDYEDLLNEQCKHISAYQCQAIRNLFENEVYPHFPESEADAGAENQ